MTNAVAQVLANALNTSRINATIPGAQSGATTLTTSQTFRDRCKIFTRSSSNASVWIGFHYRNSMVAGENLEKPPEMAKVGASPLLPATR